jgi:hypothetical protein
MAPARATRSVEGAENAALVAPSTLPTTLPDAAWTRRSGPVAARPASKAPSGDARSDVSGALATSYGPRTSPPSCANSKAPSSVPSAMRPGSRTAQAIRRATPDPRAPPGPTAPDRCARASARSSRGPRRGHAQHPFKRSTSTRAGRRCRSPGPSPPAVSTSYIEEGGAQRVRSRRRARGRSARQLPRSRRRSRLRTPARSSILDLAIDAGPRRDPLRGLHRRYASATSSGRSPRPNTRFSPSASTTT